MTDIKLPEVTALDLPFTVENVRLGTLLLINGGGTLRVVQSVYGMSDNSLGVNVALFQLRQSGIESVYETTGVTARIVGQVDYTAFRQAQNLWREEEARRQREELLRERQEIESRLASLKAEGIKRDVYVVYRRDWEDQEDSMWIGAASTPEAAFALIQRYMLEDDDEFTLADLGFTGQGAIFGDSGVHPFYNGDVITYEIKHFEVMFAE